MEQTLIIGAGISGLTAAYRLHLVGKPFEVLEADDRPGGRVCSLPAQQGSGYLEIGPTWFGDKHQRLMELIRELDLPYFTQYETGKGIYQVMSFVAPHVFEIPQGQEPYYRFAGGTRSLIQALLDQIPTDSVTFQQQVTAISLTEKGIKVRTKQGVIFEGAALILTVPLPLIVQDIKFDPALSPTLLQRFRSTQTWMSDSIKFAVEYQSPFWRQAGFAGLLMSQNGPVKEMHDHCDEAGSTFALMGFLHPSAVTLPPVEREKQVLQQIAQHFGQEALLPLAYHDTLWAQQHLTSETGVQPMTMKPPYGHPDLRQPYWNGRLHFAAAETDHLFGGYMDGAVGAAERVIQSMMNAK